MKKRLLPIVIGLLTLTNANAHSDFNSNDTLSTVNVKHYHNQYGYFKDFKSGVNNDHITFDFGFVNTNKQTIESIKLYFNIKDNFGETYGNGYLIGSGPIEGRNTANYKQNHIFNTNDTNHEIEITNVVLTYTDGTKKILDKKSIKYN